MNSGHEIGDKLPAFEELIAEDQTGMSLVPPSGFFFMD